MKGRKWRQFCARVLILCMVFTQTITASAQTGNLNLAMGQAASSISSGDSVNKGDVLPGISGGDSGVVIPKPDEPGGNVSGGDSSEIIPTPAPTPIPGGDVSGGDAPEPTPMPTPTPTPTPGGSVSGGDSEGEEQVKVSDVQLEYKNGNGEYFYGSNEAYMPTDDMKMTVTYSDGTVSVLMNKYDAEWFGLNPVFSIYDAKTNEKLTERDARGNYPVGQYYVKVEVAGKESASVPLVIKSLMEWDVVLTTENSITVSNGSEFLVKLPASGQYVIRSSEMCSFWVNNLYRDGVLSIGGNEVNLGVTEETYYFVKVSTSYDEVTLTLEKRIGLKSIELLSYPKDVYNVFSMPFYHFFNFKFKFTYDDDTTEIVYGREKIWDAYGMKCDINVPGSTESLMYKVWDMPEGSYVYHITNSIYDIDLYVPFSVVPVTDAQKIPLGQTISNDCRYQLYQLEITTDGLYKMATSGSLENFYMYNAGLQRVGMYGQYVNGTYMMQLKAGKYFILTENFEHKSKALSFSINKLADIKSITNESRDKQEVKYGTWGYYVSSTVSGNYVSTSGSNVPMKPGAEITGMKSPYKDMSGNEVVSGNNLSERFSLGVELKVTLEDDSAYDVFFNSSLWDAFDIQEKLYDKDGNPVYADENGYAPIGDYIVEFGAQGKSVQIPMYVVESDTVRDIRKTEITIEEQNYTGKEVTPIPVVKYGDDTLVYNEDYTITYADNVEQGTAKATLKGIGKYSGKVETTFVIACNYEIKFAGNGATSGTMDCVDAKYGESYTLPASAYKKTGYKFIGWNTKADGTGTAYANNAKVTNLTKVNKGVVTLYAQWEIVEYKITYYLNGGVNDSSNPASYTVETETFTLKNPTKTGNTFMGWYTDAEFTTKASATIAKGSTGNRNRYAKWELNKYTIKFAGNGATGGTMSDHNNRKYNVSYTLPECSYMKTGYVFTGWNTKADGTGTAYAAGDKVKNLSTTNGAVVTLYAQWKIVEYKITYYLNGGANNSSNPASYTVETETFTLKNPTRKGYTFVGWYTDEGFTTKASATIAKGSTGNRNRYAKWEAVEYKINYYLGGGVNNSSNPTSYTVETETINLKNPTRKGYTFAGWYTDAEFTTKASATIAKGSTGNRNRYAKWEAVEYKINYYLGGGVNNSSNPASYTVETETFTLKNPARRGYTFEGWYTDAEFTTKASATIAKGSTGDRNRYAKWTLNKYIIRFAGNGATSGTMSDHNNRKYTVSYTLPACSYKKTGYTFVGWNSKADGTGTMYAAGDKVKNLSTVDGAVVTLYAQWETVEYKINYYLNGGVNNSSNPAGYTIETETFTLKNPTKTGSTFAGWYTDAEFTTKASATIAKGSTGNRNRYAKWELNKYSIKFAGNGATSGTMSNHNNRKYGVSYTLPECSYKKTGYVFVGWNTKADGTGTMYEAGDKVKSLSAVNGATVTLYAQWEKQ